jgi:diacylglycerol kinase (ATP)
MKVRDSFQQKISWMSRRALLISNRNARRGQTVSAKAIPLLQSHGFELIEDATSKPGQLNDLLLRYRDQVDLVIIAGGDGTLNAAINGLVETKLPLGIIPAGTANDLARTLKLPTDLAAACEVIAKGESRRIDLGWVNGKHYFNVAGLGISAQITRQLSKESKGWWGPLAYLWTAARVVVQARSFRAVIRAGDEVMTVNTVQILVGNGPSYGGALNIAEGADIDDDQLDLVSLEISRWWQILPLLPAMHLGTLQGSPRVRTLRGREFEVETHSPRRVNADGELTTQTPARFRVIPQALRVFVPQLCP